MSGIRTNREGGPDGADRTICARFRERPLRGARPDAGGAERDDREGETPGRASRVRRRLAPEPTRASEGREAGPSREP